MIFNDILQNPVFGFLMWLISHFKIMNGMPWGGAINVQEDGTAVLNNTSNLGSFLTWFPYLKPLPFFYSQIRKDLTSFCI